MPVLLGFILGVAVTILCVYVRSTTDSIERKLKQHSG